LFFDMVSIQGQAGGQKTISETQARRINWRHYVGRYEVVMAILNILLALFFYWETPRYVAPANIYTLLRYTEDIGILTIAEVPIMFLGLIDLSPTGIANLVPLIDWSLWQYFMAVGIAFYPALIIATLIAWLLAAFIGFINGVVIAKGKVNFLVATVATLFATNGFALIGWGGWPEPFPGADRAYFFSGTIGGVLPIPFIWALAYAILIMFLFYRTKFGVYVTAGGSNPTWAREAGVPVDKYTIIAYVLSGLAGGILGVIDGSVVREVSATNFTSDLTLEAIAAAVIGGTLLTGGKGTPIGSFLGALLIAQLLDGFTVLGINAYAYDAIVGIAILVLMVTTENREAFTQYFRRITSLRMTESVTTDGGSKNEKNERSKEDKDGER